MAPFPSSSQGGAASRWSGDSLAPSDGYSGLFTSGLMRAPSSPRLECNTFNAANTIFPSSPFAPSPSRSPIKHSSPTKLAPPLSTPARRRRSSILHATSGSASPSKLKSGVGAEAIDRALDNVMRNLKLFSASPIKGGQGRPQLQSRWSSSTEGSMGGEDEERNDKPRKSGESVRSVRSKLTIRSKKSARSLKSRRSEDTDRMEVDQEEVPPLPPVQIPTTPSRGRRVVEGLARRLGLTPKKKHGPPPTPAPVYSPPSPPLPLPTPIDRNLPLPHKTSLSTLRSLTKKASTGTLRSVRSVRPQHPFLANHNVTDCDTPPIPFPLPLPYEHDVPSCVPTTPRRMPKSSIGPPRARAEISPSTFLREMPRRAPETPKRNSDSEARDDSNDPNQSRREDTPEVPSEEIITFGTPAPELTHDHATPDMSMFIATPSTGIPQTPRSGGVPISFPAGSGDDGTPLTAKSAAANLGKGNRLLHLLPRQQRANMGVPPRPRGVEHDGFSAARRPGTGARPGAGAGAGASIPALKNGLPSTNPLSRRDPLGVLSSNTASTPDSLAYRAGEPWGTPTTPGSYPADFEKYFPNHNHQLHQKWDESTGTGTFGPTPPLALRKARARVGAGAGTGLGTLDFSAPPTEHVRNDSGDSTSAGVSLLGTQESGDEGWELERYLRDLEGEEPRRSDEVDVGVVGWGR